MCGIVYGIDLKKRSINQRILDQFHRQKSRGRLGFGLYDGEYGNIVKSHKEEKLLNWLKKYPSTEILFHHRYPTSTANTKSASHPFSTKDFFDTNYILVHNGQISNSYELKREHEKLGIVYQSIQKDGRFNDSEALAWDVSLYLEGKQDALKAKGTIAFICIAKSDKGDKLYFARNTNPLNMSFKKQVLFLSSEGKGQAIDPDKLYTFDYETKKVTNTTLEIPKSYVYKAPKQTPTNYLQNFGTSTITEDEQDWAQWAKNQADKYSKDAEEVEEIENILDAKLTELVDAQPETLINMTLSYKDNVDSRKRDIQEVFKHYINATVSGSVVDAYQLAERDVTWLEEAISLYWVANLEVDYDLEYELEIHTIVKKMLYSDPAWNQPDTPHALFTKKTLSVQDIIRQKLLESKNKGSLTWVA